MNKRISRNGINRIAREYHDILYKELHFDPGNGNIPPSSLFELMVTKLADMLADDNENFNRQRFLDAIYEDNK